MDLFRYLVRFLYKIRWYLVILPMIALIVAWFLTRDTTLKVVSVLLVVIHKQTSRT